MEQDLNLKLDNKMVIDWVPWFDTPMHRRLELISVGFIVFCEIALGPICTFVILLAIVIYSGKNIFFSIYLLQIKKFNLKMIKNQLFCLFQYFGNFYIRAICLSYLAFIYYDRHTGDQGGRGVGYN